MIKNVKTYYEKRYSKNLKISRSLKSYKNFFNILNPGRCKKLLDVGCGKGVLLSLSDKRGIEGYGIDISENALNYAKKITRSNLSLQSGDNLKFKDGYFDYVISLGAVEHHTDLNKCVLEISRVLKKKGKALILVPNLNFILWLFKKNKGTEQRDCVEHLLNLYEWKRLFIKNSFSVRSIRKDHFVSYDHVSIVSKIKYKLLNLLLIFVPLKYTYQFIFVLVKN